MATSMAEHTETRGIKIALGSYLALVALQLATYFITGILVFFAQALEMISDVLISTFLLLSASWSRRPADEFHMFGHGRAQNVAALVSATILVSFMSIETLREAVPKLFQSPDVNGFSDVNLALAVLVVGMLVVAVPLIDILRVKSKGASVKAQLIALFKDEFSYVVALIAVLLVARGFYLADAAASIVVAGPLPSAVYTYSRIMSTTCWGDRLAENSWGRLSQQQGRLMAC